MQYDLFLFDLDDTLMDFSAGEKNAIFSSFESNGYPNGLSDYRESYREISKVLWDDLEQGRIALAELKTETVQALVRAAWLGNGRPCVRTNIS